MAQDIDIVFDAGAYTTVSPVVLSRGGIHAGGPYACPNVRIHARAAMTNTPPNGAFRGFGAPQSEFAAETHLDRVAEALGMSPLEIRRRNAYREGDTTATGQVLRESVAALDVLEAAAEASGFERIWQGHDAGARPDGEARAASGIGIALGWHGAGFTGSGEATARQRGLRRADGGRRDPRAGRHTEMGQGSRTVLGQVVAEALGVEPDVVDVVRPDTSRVPDTGPTVASRTTMLAGGLLATAAAHLRSDVEAVTRPARSPSPSGPSRRPTAPSGPRSSSTASRGSCGTTTPTTEMPTPPTAGRAPWPRWTRTSTRARSGSGRSSRPPTRVAS